MAAIYLLKWNNYYNRRVKHLTPANGTNLELSDFTDAGATSLVTIYDVNFKYGDGVHQELILNYDIEGFPQPDYCLVYDDNQKVTSSVWFVMNCERTRNGQCRLLLYRDLINTHYDDIINAPCFIEKATLAQNNPLIFNSENMSFNQIKTKETKLKDSFPGAWIVGYIDTSFSSSDSKSFSYKSKATITDNEHSHYTWDYAAYTSGSPAKIANNDIEYKFYVSTNIPLSKNVNKFYFNSNSQRVYSYLGSIKGYNVGSHSNYIHTISGTNYKGWFNYTTLYSDLCARDSLITESTYNDIMSYNNKYIAFTDGVFKCEVTVLDTSISVNEDFSDNSSIQTDIDNTVSSGLSTLGITPIATVSPKSGVEYSYKTLYVTLTQSSTPTTEGTYAYTFSTSFKNCKDAQYKMFCIPYFNHIITNYICYGDVAMQWAMSIATELGGTNGHLYDLQILPYCPIKQFYYDSGKINTDKYGTLTAGTDVMYLYRSGSTSYPQAIAYFADYCNFSVDINVSISIEDNKISNECDLYRICSPNYSGVFEFSPAKNGGVDKFIAECTYKPQNPYICIHPHFNGLYGKDFGDSRGLICGGDFSLPIITDAWTTYQIQNKNYENIFNRQIENMDVNNKVNNTNLIWQTIAGTAQGVTSGAMAGAISGGGAAGAIIGGLVGGGTSLGAGIADIQNTKKLQKETIDYTYDQFGYQLGNIKALPNTLSKVGSLTANSKFIPFLEYYTCTDTEKEALQNKLKYNGMSVGVIGTITDYQLAEESYIKGKIIRLEDMDIDFHEATLIADEINKGVFI